MAKNIATIKNSPSTKQIGDYGEKVTQKYLKRHGYVILDTNYYKSCGELDIVAKNNDIVHFVEVKTFSYKSKSDLKRSIIDSDAWRPEEQVHHHKLHQISKALELWLVERDWAGEWQIDVASVRVVPEEKYATVKYIPNIIAD